jgi:hypothetical protein
VFGFGLHIKAKKMGRVFPLDQGLFITVSVGIAVWDVILRAMLKSVLVGQARKNICRDADIVICMFITRNFI